MITLNEIEEKDFTMAALKTAPSAASASSEAGPKKRQRRNRDEAVMKEAISIMAEKGYVATSIQEVADRVGVLKGSLYHYFSSKEELLVRILIESHEQTSAIDAEVRALGLAPHEELLEQMRRSSLWFLENPERASIFFTEVKHLTGDRHTEARKRGRAFEERLGSLITAGQKDGTIRDDIDHRILTRFVVGTVSNVRNWLSRPGSQQFSIEKLADSMVALVDEAVKARP